MVFHQFPIYSKKIHFSSAFPEKSEKNRVPPRINDLIRQKAAKKRNGLDKGEKRQYIM